MRRTEEEERLRLGINTTGTTKIDLTTDLYEPDDVPLQKVGVILRSRADSNTRTKSANKTIAAPEPPILVATVQNSTSTTSEATAEIKSNNTTSASG